MGEIVAWTTLSRFSMNGLRRHRKGSRAGAVGRAAAPGAVATRNGGRRSQVMIRWEVGMARNRVRTARLLAVAADVVQIALAPLFVGGGASPVNDVLDLAMAAAMTWLGGWDLGVTAAVFFATRGQAGTVSNAARQNAIDAEVVSSGPASTPPPRG